MTTEYESIDEVTPEQAAKRDAKNIHTSLERDNAATAYGLMSQEINDARYEFGPNTSGFVKYRDTLTQELKKSDDIAALAPIWGQNAFPKLEITNSSGTASGTIGARELSPYVTGVLPTDGLTKSFATELREQVQDRSFTREQLGTLSDSREIQRNQSIVLNLEQSKTRSYAELLDGKTSTGLSLFRLADLAGAGTNSQNVDGKVVKADIDALIKAGKDGFTPLKESEIASLQYFSDNWDTLPEIRNLRQTRDANGTVTTDDAITVSSLQTARNPKRAQERVESEESATDTSDQSKLAIKMNADLLLNHKTLDGKTLFDAADYAGGKVDQLVGKEDIDALLNSAQNGLVRISDADRNALKRLSDGWNNDAQVTALRQEKFVDAYGNPVTSTNTYISPDSLKVASGEFDRAKQKQDAEQSRKLDESSVKTRTDAADLAKDLKTLKFGKNDLFTAADIYGSVKDGLVNKDAVDNKVNDDDLKKLASVLLIANGADSREYKLINDLISKWNTPAVKALRGGRDYITPESMSAVALR